MNIAEIHNTLVGLVAKGDEAGALAFLRSHFLELPAAIQGEILTSLYVEALTDEADRIEAIGKIQEAGVAAIKALEILEAELGVEALGTNSGAES